MMKESAPGNVTFTKMIQAHLKEPWQRGKGGPQKKPRLNQGQGRTGKGSEPKTSIKFQGIGQPRPRGRMNIEKHQKLNKTGGGRKEGGWGFWNHPRGRQKKEKSAGTN